MNINKRLSQIAEIEFSDIVEMAEESEDKLRIYLIDESFIDVWFSRKIEGRYAYHRERGHIDGKIYRHDNIPHKRWEYVKTFPKHFQMDRKTKLLRALSVTSLPGQLRKYWNL